jgi:amino acid adenylation domain-containing protein/non-ribosomal peptide synthase protein (TIGR01720 family)
MSDPARRIAALQPDQLARLLRDLGQRKAAGAAVQPIRPRPPGGGPVALSFSQERVWLLDQIEPGTPVYNMAAAFELAGKLEIPALAAVLREVVRRHESLRTIFRAAGGRPVQVVVEELAPPVPLLDLATLPEPARRRERRRLAQRATHVSFALDRGPLLCTWLVREDPHRHTLLLTIHHIVSDGWSTAVFLREVAALYAAFAAGQPSPLPPPEIQFPDFAIWQRERLRGAVRDELTAYWREQLSGVPALELPADHPRPAIQSHHGASHCRLVPPPLAALLRRFAAAQGVTLFMALLAAYDALLNRYSGQEDFCVGTYIANRNRTQLEGLMGFLVNNLALRARVDPAASCGALLARVRDTTTAAYAHQDLPFEALLEALGTARSSSHTPIFQVMLVLQNSPQARLELPGLTVRRANLGVDWANFDLTLWIEEGDGLEMRLDYAADLFAAPTAARLASHFVTLLVGLAADPARPVAELPLLTAEERHQLLAEWSRTPGGYRRDVRLHEIFAEQAARAPEAAALACSGLTLTYGELATRSGRLARTLRGQGVEPDVRVGLLAERVPELVIGMLAILEAGGGFLPLDPGYPPARQAWLLADAEAAVLLAQERLAAPQAAAFPRLVLLDVHGPEEEEEVARPPLPQPGPAAAGGTLAGPRVPAGALAWLIYTSGSTGKPKGVAVSHANAVPLLLWSIDYFGLGPGTRVLQSLSQAFDFGVLEILSTLLAGGVLHLAGDGFGDPRRWAERAREQDIDTVHATPSFFGAVAALGERLPAVRTLHFGGEALFHEQAARLLAAAGESCVLYNGYGPTEVTVNCSIHAAGRNQARPAGEAVPIGRPYADNTAYVVDQRGQPVPTGVPGELLLGGPGVARGYHGRPDLTAERFVPDPFGDEPGARLYRSGDLVRWLPDGNLEFLGRADHQLKIRGLRIEPGEIEAALMRHPGVSQAVVMAREAAPGDRRLVAYVVGAAGAAPPARELRELLAESLPAYMVPWEIVDLGALPLTPTGKLDRRALPAPESAPEPAERAAPRTPAEELAAGIWEEVLGVERVGVHDNFFELGGHSLVAAQIAARLQDAFGAEVSLRTFFEAPTVAELASRMESAGASEVPPLGRAPRGGDLPLSFAQERIWFLAQLDPESAAYHVPRAVWITGRLDAPALAWAYGALIERHEILRTTFPAVDGRPVQRIHPEPPAAWSRLPLCDLRALAPPRRQRELERLIVADGRRRFDLARGPLLRASLARTGDDEHVVIQTEHHLVHDGWAEAVLLGDLLELYAARTQRRPSRLPELPIQYADYACWQREWLRGEVLERQLAYWRAQLAGAPPLLALPTDRPRPAVLSARGRAHEVVLEGALVLRLAALGRRLGSTLFMTMLAAFAAVLHRWSGQFDVVVSTSIANRRRREMEGMLGMVINTLALRTDLARDPRLRQLLTRVRETCLGAYAHQDTPFHRVVDALGAERTLSWAPLAQAHFAFHDARFPEVDLPGLSLRPGELHNRSSKFDLTLVLRPVRERTASGPARGGMVIHHEYSSDLFDPPTMLRLIGHYQVLLESVAASAGDGPRLSELPLLTEPERFQLLREWCQPALRQPPACCLHELFAERVRSAPAAVAVAGEGESLTYGELDRRANQLARHLRRLGVGPEVRVAIRAGRSPLLIVGLMGILKAGGTYVPLSPSDPAERLQLILEDALAGVPLPLLLAEKGNASQPSPLAAGSPRLPPAMRILHLDADWEAIAAEDGGPLPPGALPSNTAYVIYTSGSTGRPKGVLVPHANVVRLFEATDHWFGFGPGDAWTLFHSCAFDFSVWEIWGALLHGGRLVVVPHPVSRSPELFRELLVREGVTVLNQTPSAFRNFSEADSESVPGFSKQVPVAGDRGLLEASIGSPPATPRSPSLRGSFVPPSSDLLALRFIIFGGEALELAALAPWFARHGDAAPRLINMYGITETTVHVTYRPVSTADLQETHRSPLGVPIPDLRLHLLDGRGNPAPLGVAAEIHVGGAGLAHGYLGRPELTAERFVPDPFAAPAGEPGARLYRSGDLARYRPNGDMDYLGRIDSQVKIRGFRIELGEIEAALGRHPAVRRTVVMARTRQDGWRQLVAYLVGEEGVGVEALRTFLGRQLPDHMVPALFVWMSELPLTPHGKVDLRSLPEPEAARRELSEPFALPEGAVEETLARVWEAALGVERVGRGDNFFALGGDSILSLRVLAQARARGIELSLQQLFLHQTIRELARAAGDVRSGGDRAAGNARDAGDAGDRCREPFALIAEADRRKLPEDVEDAYPLTRLQGGMVFHSEVLPEAGIYHDIFSHHLEGVCDVEAMRRAIRRLAARHPVLRTSFDLTSYGEPLQLVHREVEVGMPVEDLRHLDPRAQEAALAAMLESEKARPFVWREAPLWRCHCDLRGARAYQFTLSCHHAILDGWSVASLTSELFRLYVEPAGAALAPPPASRFRRYVALEREALASEASRRFWQAAAAGRPDARLPRWPRPAGGDAARGQGTHLVRFSPRQAAALREVAREAGVPLKSVLLAAHCRVLAQAHGQDEVITGLAFSGRPEEEGGEQVLGLFLNVLPLTARPATGSWIELARRVFADERERLPHRRYPLEQVQQEAGGEQLFETLFNFVHFHVYQGLEELGIRRLGGLYHEVNNFALAVNAALDPWDGSLTLRLGYDPDELSGAQLRAIGGWYERTLRAMSAAPWGGCGVSPLAEAERHQLLLEWNDTAASAEPEPGLYELFTAQARRTPDAAAVVCRGRCLTYGELERRAAGVARRLRASGAGPETRVGVLMSREAEMIAALLGVLGAGAAYVPLDPAYPVSRLSFMLADSGAAALLTDAASAGLLPESGIPNLRVLRILRVGGAEDAAPGAIDAIGAPPAALAPPPARLAYVIYTSGSTGRPKGAAITHRSAAALLRWAASVYGPEELAAVVAGTSICFDLSVFEIFVPLSRGGAVMLVNDVLDLLDPARFQGVTLINTVPSAAAELLRCGAVPDSVRALNLAGEPLHGSLVETAFGASRIQRVFNLYGPTEDTTYSTWVELRPGSAGKPSIGRPVTASRLYVLDGGGGVTPIGTPGEIHLAGAGLARGYLGRPDLTAEKFLPEPFAGQPGERLYRTGDLGRRLPDGAVEFLGRIDHQVKLRGFRVEPGEVEALLTSHAAVHEALVAVQQDAAGEPRLVAYVAPAELDAADLDAFLRERLPAHLLPGALVLLPALPRTPNGKPDRAALPVPDWLAAPVVPAAPRTPHEEVLAGIWSVLLGRGQVGAHDSFFALGGHSLQAVRLISRVRDVFAVELPLRSIFESPTLAGLAARIAAPTGVAGVAGGVGAPTPPLTPAAAGGELPLSSGQERLWFLDQLQPGSSHYNVPFAARIEGRLDTALLARCLGEVTRRHQVLRASFPVGDGGEARQVIAPASPAGGFPLPAVELSQLPAAAARSETRRLARQEARRPFHLGRGPLLRAVLLGIGSEARVLLLTVHHIVADGWSIALLVEEVTRLYSSLATGAPDAGLAELPIQYADFASWQRRVLSGPRLEALLAWWRERLAGVPAVLELPSDRPRPRVQSFRGAIAALALPPRLAADLSGLARRQALTPFMVLAAAFQALLHHYTCRTRLLVGTPVAGRNRSEIESLIGLFVNTLVLPADLAGNPAFGELMGRTRQATLGAYEHQELPFERLVEALAPARDLGRMPLVQVVLVLQNAPRAAIELPGLTLQPLPDQGGTTKFDLTLTLAEDGSTLAGGIEYSTDLFDAATVGRWARHFVTLLGAAVADPELRLAELPLLGEAERHQLLREWNGPRAEPTAESCLHDLFAAQAGCRPHAVAAVCGDQSLSYGGLQARADLLARRLLRLGVGAETLVGILLERSLEMVVAILAVHTAGGAYLPLDPAHPPERLAWMLGDAGATVLLAGPGLLESRGLVPELARLAAPPAVVRLDDAGPAIAAEETPAPRTFVSPANLAYVIYTSGSTGRPKGVQVTHGQVARLLAATRGRFGFGEQDTWTLFHSYAFDFSVWELWGALALGGRLVVVPYWVSRSPERFHDLLCREQVTVLNQTPGAFLALQQAVEERAGAGELALRWVIFGGDALEPRSLAPWFSRRGERRPRLVNMYGITETTVHVTWRQLSARDALGEQAVGSRVGAPIPDWQVYLLDGSGLPVPLGVPGEIHVGGAGVARGYLGRPALTAERFVPDPFSRRAGARLYRSGDLARYRPAADLEYLGRTDQQVKVRGFRIEPGEIEAVLATHPRVREAVVLARRDEGSGPAEPGERRLAAYLTIREAPHEAPHEAPPLDLSELRAYARERLPDHMVPAVFVPLPALPLTANGKVDRAALAARGWEPPEPGARAAMPRRPAEEVLAAIWMEVLRLERVSVDDNFFDLGGDSILSIQIVARARRRGLVIEPRHLFEHQTIAELAAAAATAAAGGEVRAEQGLVTGPLPLSPIQHWFLAAERADPHHFNQSVLLASRQPLRRADLARLARVAARLLEHHDALRLRLARGGSGWEQRLAGLEGPLPCHAVDLGALPAAARAAAVEGCAAAAQASLDLAAGPLARFAIFLLGEGQPGRLLVAVHHWAIDGVSWRILLEDLASAWEQAGRGEAITLPPKTSSYRDWTRRLVERAGEGALEQELACWRELAPAGAATRLPPAGPGEAAHPAGAGAIGAPRTVPMALTAAETGALLREVPEVYHTRIDEVLLAALARAFAARTGERGLLVDLEGHGREDVGGALDLSRTVGWFTAIYPLWLALGDPADPVACLRAVKDRLGQVPNRGVGYGLLRYLRAGAAAAELAALPRPEIAFNYLGQLDQALPAGAPFVPAVESRGPEQSPRAHRPHRLEIGAAVVGGAFRTNWTYDPARLSREEVEPLAAAFLAALREIIEHCRRRQGIEYTPADFPEAGLDAELLARALAEIDAAGEIRPNQVAVSESA